MTPVVPSATSAMLMARSAAKIGLATATIFSGGQAHRAGSDRRERIASKLLRAARMGGNSAYSYADTPTSTAQDSAGTATFVIAGRPDAAAHPYAVPRPSAPGHRCRNWPYSEATWPVSTGRG